MRILKLLVILPLVLLLQACPVGLNYSMAEGNTVRIDKRLIGLWLSDNPDGEIVRVEFLPESETSLRAKVIEAGASFAMDEEYDWTVWQTELGGKQFLVFQQDESYDYYHYCFSFVGDQIVFHDVALLDGGVDAVTSAASLRDQVARSMHVEDWGQEKTTLTRE